MQINFVLNLGARYGWVVNVMPLSLDLRERDLKLALQGAVWALGQVSTGTENFASILVCLYEHKMAGYKTHYLMLSGSILSLFHVFTTCKIALIFMK